MRNQKWLRSIRIILAIFLLAGFIVLFSDVKAVVPTSWYNFFTGWQFLPSTIKFIHGPTLIAAGFILILLLTLLAGRVYCSVFCPLGIMQDVIGFVSRKIPLGKKRRRRYKKALNYLRYPILALFILSLFFLGIFLVNILDPYANFGRMASNIYQPVFLFLNNVAAKVLNSMGIYSIHPLVSQAVNLPIFVASMSVFLLILLMVIYRDRLYCNTICPVGTFLGLISRLSLYKLRFNSSSCSKCGKCQLACKANCIDIKNLQVDESRCVSCFNCISSCEDSSIQYKLAWQRNKPSIAKSGEGETRRKFLQAGLVFFGAYPLLARAEENEEENGKHARYCQRGPIAPPGSVSVEHLKDHCIGCQLCVSSCPSDVLQPSFLEYGFTGMYVPRLDNSKGFCNFDCTKCSEVCPTGAIQPISKETKKTLQIGTVQFRKRHCIVESEGTACGSCSEHCPTQAVYMVPYGDDLTIPEVNPDICVGCGACEYACPVTDPHPAIYVMPNEVHLVADKPDTEKVEVEETEDFPF